MDSSTVIRDFATTISSQAVLARSQKPVVNQYLPRPPSPASQPQVSSAGDSPTHIPFDDCLMTFAIDISQSTIGSVLAEECAFIQNFVGGLSPSARGLARVIPWDEISHPIITVEGLANIKPAGRTDPNVLLKNREHIDLLQASHLWFLLTDGEIVPNTVRRFAFSINSRSLHGTACVIVIFGRLPPRPTLCNVSVGISVFAVTPNCVFVFHDVDTHRAYILQCKGCFNALLPRGTSQTSLNSSTEWSDIPELHYSNLFDIEIPPPATLDVNQFQLQSGEKVDLEDLYHGNISRVIENKILHNEDNLKSVLLIATTRGRNQDVRDWIASRRDSFTDLVNMPRPDLNGTAATLLSTAINAFCDSGCALDDFEFAEAAALQRAHALNWDAFRVSVQPRTQKASQRSIIIDDSLARLDLIGRAGPASAECMSPVSPGGSKHSGAAQTVDEGPCSKLIAPTGYMLRARTIGYNFTCPVCGSKGPYIAILLKRPPMGSRTPGFPQQQSRADISFPLAMGGYIETDIISDLTCCAPCSVHVLQAVNSKISPRLDRLVGVVVFGYNLSAADSINQETWISNIDRALDGRIAPRCLLQVLLAIMFAAKERATLENPNLARTLDMACKMFVPDLQIQYEVGNHHWTGRATDVVQHHTVVGIASPACDFLDHPVDSFAIIIRSCRLPIGQKSMSLYIRLVLHIIEHSNILQDSENVQIAAEFCALLRSQISNGEDIDQILSNIHRGQLSTLKGAPPHHLMDVLIEKNLVDEEVVRICRQVKQDGFDIIETSCERALCLFVCLFQSLNITNKEPRQVLHWYCTRPELERLFETPWELGNDEAKRIWESMT